MKMKFIGTDGSMGLRKGYVYNVKAIKGPLFQRYNLWVEIENSLITTQTRCPYDSFEAFFKNWQIFNKTIDERIDETLERAGHKIDLVKGSHTAMFVPEELRSPPKEECDCCACRSDHFRD